MRGNHSHVRGFFCLIDYRIGFKITYSYSCRLTCIKSAWKITRKNYRITTCERERNFNLPAKAKPLG